MTTQTPVIKIMRARGVLSRELQDLEVGQILHAPYKYASVTNIKKTICILRKQGLDFHYSIDDDAFAVITRTA